MLDALPPVAYVAAAALAGLATIGGAWLGRRTTTTTTAATTATEQIVAIDVNTLLEQVAAAQADAAAAQAEATSAKADAAAAKAQAATAQAEVTALRTQMGTYSQRERALERDIALRDRRIDDLEGRVVKLEGWIRAQGADPQLIADGIADAWVAPDPDQGAP